MFRTPIQEMLRCFVPLKMTCKNVSYPLFFPKPNMFRTPRFFNNTDICFVPPPNSVTTLICFVPLNFVTTLIYVSYPPPNSVTTVTCSVPLPIICWNNQIVWYPLPLPHRIPQCLVAACVCLFDCWCNA